LFPFGSFYQCISHTKLEEQACFHYGEKKEI
jgi:hypothetical protein